jgi:hypothetical protein
MGDLPRGGVNLSYGVGSSTVPTPYTKKAWASTIIKNHKPEGETLWQGLKSEGVKPETKT